EARRRQPPGRVRRRHRARAAGAPWPYRRARPAGLGARRPRGAAWAAGRRTAPPGRRAPLRARAAGALGGGPGRRRGPAARAAGVGAGTHGEGVLGSAVPAPEGSGWLRAARTHGIVVRADDDEVPLAAVRGCSREVVAAAGDWLVEVLCDAVPPPEAPAVLRA